MCTFGLSGCRAEPRRPHQTGPPGLHTTTRELQTRTFERPGASNTTKIPREKPPEREERMTFPVGREQKKREIWGPPPSGPPPLRAPTPSGPWVRAPLRAPTPSPPKTKLAKCGLAKFGQQKLAKFEIRMAKCGQLTLAKCGIGQIRFGQMRSNKDGQIRFGQIRPRPCFYHGHRIQLSFWRIDHRRLCLRILLLEKLSKRVLASVHVLLSPVLSLT